MYELAVYTVAAEGAPQYFRGSLFKGKYDRGKTQPLFLLYNHKSLTDTRNLLDIARQFGAVAD